MLSNPEAARTADSTRDVIKRLADIVSLVEPRLLDLWRSTGITFAQRRLLRRLRHGRRSPSSLAAELGITGPTLTRHLQRLEDAGLVSRTVDSDDRRRIVVELTDAGRKSLTGNKLFSGSPLALAVADLSTSERKAIVVALDRLVELARDRDANG